VIGFLMRRFDFPVAPVLVGMILGPLAEQQFRRALAISQGDLQSSSRTDFGHGVRDHRACAGGTAALAALAAKRKRLHAAGT
jgi:TctA family transporter